VPGVRWDGGAGVSGALVRLGPLRWTCLGPGWPPKPCDAEGSTIAGAERHANEAKHCTVTSQRPEEET